MSHQDQDTEEIAWGFCQLEIELRVHFTPHAGREARENGKSGARKPAGTKISLEILARELVQLARARTLPGRLGAGTAAAEWTDLYCAHMIAAKSRKASFKFVHGHPPKQVFTEDVALGPEPPGPMERDRKIR